MVTVTAKCTRRQRKSHDGKLKTLKLLPAEDVIMRVTVIQRNNQINPATSTVKRTKQGHVFIQLCHFRLVFAGLKHSAADKRTLNINPEMGLLISIQLKGWNHPSPAVLKSIYLTPFQKQKRQSRSGD